MEVPSSSFWDPGSRSRSPRADAAMVQAPPAGSTDAASQKAAPTSAANTCNKDTLTCCRACCAAGCGQSAPHNTSLARACTPPRPPPIYQIASAAMPVRRGARPGREHHHTRRAHRTPVRIPDARRRLASRTSAGVVGVASKHSESSHPRPRPRSREPGTIPPPSGFPVYDGEGGSPRGRASHALTEDRRNLRPRVRRRPEAHQSRLGTAERRLRGAL